MPYKSKNFSHLLGLEGFSDTLLQNHFKLYEGYVANTNKIIELVKGSKDLTSPDAVEMKRRLGWEWNGMRLHELYFGNLTKEPQELNPNSTFGKQLSETYPSIEYWLDYVKTNATFRGVGWVITYWDSIGKRLLTFWVNEHDTGHPVGCVPLLVLDVFEHAYLTDYGLARADYIDSFMKAIDWNEVNKRFENK